MADLKTRLVAEPDFAVSYIVNNNPDAVIDRLRGYGFTIAKFEDIETALNHLIEKGEWEKFSNSLNVPLLTESMDPGDIIAVKEAAIALNAQAGRNVATYKSFDSNAFFGALALGVSSYMENTGSQSVNMTQGSPPPPPAPKKDNTWLYVGLGVGVLLLVVLTIIIIKRSK